MNRSNIIRPGLFSVQVACDSRRIEFDCKNEIIIANNTDIDFVFIGDSITHMWELNAYFGKKNRLIINRGIGGDTTEYMLKRFEADVIQLKPKYCVSMIGINDSWILEPEPWTGKSGELVEVVLEKAKKNITNLVDLAKQMEQEIIICSLLPAKMVFTQNNNGRNEYVVSLNSYIKTLCKSRNIIYVDYYQYFVEEDGITLKAGLTYEGLHPHVCGYNVMADVLRNTLARNDIEI